MKKFSLKFDPRKQKEIEVAILSKDESAAITHIPGEYTLLIYATTLTKNFLISLPGDIEVQE